MPMQYSTIWSGLYAAQAGDTVLVSPGTYRERLVWPDRDSIVLLSEAGAEATIIRPPNDSGRVILMPYASITNATVLKGFTITGGRLVSTITSPGYGAGMHLIYASPTVCYNRIIGNRIDVPGGVGVVGNAIGAGVRIYAERAPVFHHNLFAGNRIVHDRTQAGNAWGAGVYCDGPGIFYQNEFRDNTSRTVGQVPAPAVTARGGGLGINGGPALVYSNLFVGNQAGDYDIPSAHAMGGGLYVSAPAYICGNTFVNNTAKQAFGWGGAICVWDTFFPIIKNNIIVANSASGTYGYGGGIAFRGDTTRGYPVYNYNNVWANSPDDYYGCIPGTRSLSADPLFVNGPAGDYYLSQIASGQQFDSPCVDKGDTMLMTLPVNLDSLRRMWTTRTDYGPDAFAPDMGYHYPIERSVGAREVTSFKLQASGLIVEPNPVTSGFATLRLASGTAPARNGRNQGQSLAQVRVFDAVGRCVLAYRLFTADWQRGIPLDIRCLSSGVYLVWFECGADSKSTRLVVQR